QYAGSAGQFTRLGASTRLVDRSRFVVAVRPQQGRNYAHACSLDTMFAAASARQHRRGGGLERHDPATRVRLAYASGRADEHAGRTHTSTEGVGDTRKLLDYLTTECQVAFLCVAVVELVSEVHVLARGQFQRASAHCGYQVTGDRSTLARDDDDVGAERAHRLQLLLSEGIGADDGRSEEHTSELQSRENLVCRLLL